MGWFGDLLAKWRGEATKKATELATEQAAKATAAATEQAARAAAASAKKAVGAVAEDFVGFAERELERARKERGTQEAPAEGEEPAPDPAAQRRAEKEAREARAREELARLKAERKG